MNVIRDPLPDTGPRLPHVGSCIIHVFWGGGGVGTEHPIFASFHSNKKVLQYNEIHPVA